jgi:DNA-binding response OmpR family regulator
MHNPAHVQAEPTSILFVDPTAADAFLPRLRQQFEVTAVSSEAQALRAIKAMQPTLVVTELALPDGDGISLCRQTKTVVPSSPTVLALTSAPDRVPEALKAGCDGVLIKPFAPNLLYARIGRLLRTRAKAITERAMWQRAKSAFLIEHSHRVMTGTNVVCENRHCPSCGQAGAVAFDASSHRRMWYACLPCGKVWLGPALELD